MLQKKKVKIMEGIIGFSNSYITLSNNRRIAKIKPGIDGHDAVNKSQMQNYCYDRTTIDNKLKNVASDVPYLINGNNVDFVNKRIINVHEGVGGDNVVIVRQLNQEIGKVKRSVNDKLDNVFLPQLDSNDTVDFKNKRITNIGDPVNPQDAVNKSQIENYITQQLDTVKDSYINYFNSNRITKVYLTWVDDGAKSKFGGEVILAKYICLYKGVLINVNSDYYANSYNNGPYINPITIFKTEYTDFPKPTITVNTPISFYEYDLLTFTIPEYIYEIYKSQYLYTGKIKISINLDIQF